MCIGAVSFFSLRNVIQNYSVVTDVSFPNTTSMLQMFSNYRMVRIDGLHIISDVDSEEDKLEMIKNINENKKTDQELKKQYEAVDFLPGEEVLYNDFRAKLDFTYSQIDKVVELYQKSKTDKSVIPEMNNLMIEKVGKSGNEIKFAMKKLKEFHFAMAERSMKKASKASSESTVLIITLIGVLGSIGIFSAIIFTRYLLNSLQSVSDALTVSSAEVSSAALQIATSSEVLSQSTTEQAASLQETSASVEELSSMVSVNSENAQKSSHNSSLSLKQAERGQEVVAEMVQSMNEINESNNNIMTQINHSNQQMGEIVKVIEEIANKTKVINDIVFQTKLLSFNASVEAARAGEQGKGFAVVAEEVGNLAQMSGNAAKEISDMLASSVQKVESIVNETQTKVDGLIVVGKVKVEKGTKIAQECGTVLSEIVSNVATVSSMASEISNASTEQSKGIIEINKAMAQLDQVTNTNTVTAQDSANAAELLSKQANSLKEQVVNLVSVINGSNDGNKEIKTIPTKKAPTNKVVFEEVKKPSKDVSNVLPIKKKETKTTSQSKPTSIAPKKTVEQKVEMKKTADHTPPVQQKFKEGVPRHDHPGFEDV